MVNRGDASKPLPTRQRVIAAAVLCAYLSLVGGLAGWLGHDFFNWRNVAIFVALPALFGMGRGLPVALRTGSGVMWLFHVVVYPLVAAVFIGGSTLLGAYVISQSIGGWEHRMARTAVGVAVMAGISALVMRVYRPGKTKPTTAPPS